MSSPTQLHLLKPSDWQQYRALRLNALADSPDAFGGTFAAERERPDAVWMDRLSAAETSGVDLPLKAEQAGQAVGLVWAKIDAADRTIVNIFQMWVAPPSRGSGVGQALLNRAIEWAGTTGAQVVQLGVTCGDSPAVRLYTRAGFRPHGAPDPLRPGSPLLAQYMRRPLVAGH